MKDERFAKLEKLYALATSSAQLAPPKRAFLSWKCSKCDAKLDKESVRDVILVGKGGTEFGNKVGANAKLDPGVYQLHIDHFTCKNCGYEFAKADTIPVEGSSV